VRLPPGIRPAVDDLQPLRALGQTWRVADTVPRACRAGPSPTDADDRCHPRQDAPLGLGRKRRRTHTGDWPLAWRAQHQDPRHCRCQGTSAVHPAERWRGHDCSPAPRLIRRTKPARRLLGDKAYDIADLRQWLGGRGTTPVIPNKSNRKQPFSFNRRAYKERHRIESGASPRATTDWHETSSPPSVSSLLSYGGFYES